jgi:hypothetical protein
MARKLHGKRCGNGSGIVDKRQKTKDKSIELWGRKGDWEKRRIKHSATP